MMLHVPRRVGILKPSALGDIAHALPVLNRVRIAWPEAHITWVVNRGFAGLLQNHPQLDAVLPFDRGTFRGSLFKSARYAWEFSNQLRRQHWDLVLDLQGLLRTGLMCGMSGSPLRIGFAAAREGSRHFLTHAIDIPNADRLHAVDRYLALLDAIGVPDTTVKFVLPVDPLEQAAAEQALAGYPRPWVALALGAKWLTKRWPVAQFIRTLQASRVGTVVLVGASEDAPLSEEFRTLYTSPTLDLTGKTSLPRLVAVLKIVDVMLANDTGPLHVAAALGTKCVAPYTCTTITKHGPYQQFSSSVETEVPCRGSYLKQCPNGLKCFEELSPSRIIPLLNASLG
ncbi:MAG: glycosyltransferase family 9 protein [Fimbriiglobus sp.]